MSLHSPVIGPACPLEVEAEALALWGRWTVDFDRMGLDIAGECRIWLPGKPIPKGRPRAGQSRIVTPPATRRFEGMVGSACQRVGVTVPRGDDIAVAAQVVVIHRRVGWETAKKREQLRVKARHRSDLDNVVKSVLDGAQRSPLIADDSHVVALQAWRVVPPLETPKAEGVILSLAWCRVVAR